MNIIHSMFSALHPRLDMRHLRMIVAIAKAGGVSGAARLLGVTPSALTHRIREAERRLGIALYGRVKGRLRPTPAGEVLRNAAERLLADLDRAEVDAFALAGGAEHVVRIGIGFYTAYHWLPGFLNRLATAGAETRVEIVAGAARQPFEMLRDGGIDVAIVASDPAGPGIAGVRLFGDELVAIMAPDHPLGARPHIVAEDLVGETYLTYSYSNIPGHEHDRLFHPAGVHPRRYINVELPEAIVDQVAAGFGVSILARWAVAPHIRSGSIAHARVTAQGLDIDWHAAVRAADGADSPGHRLATALADWCREVPDAFATRWRPRAALAR